MFDKNFVDSVFARNEMVTVVFKKRDGSRREMLCTTNASRIPTELLPSDQSAGAPAASSESKRVFELLEGKAGQWRSFRYDSVVALETHG